MTKLLEQAVAAVAKLDGEEQDSVARWLLDELAAERRWEAAFAASPAALAKLAEEALVEHRAGKTLDLDPDQL